MGEMENQNPNRKTTNVNIQNTNKGRERQLGENRVATTVVVTTKVY